jgi:septum formation protein
MLRSLSTTRHQVVTGVCVVRTPDFVRHAAVERTWVTMRAIRSEEVDAYVRSEEWRDKAGGYAIQEHADCFVTRLEEGGYDNVVGLPVALTLRLLSESGAPPPL